MGKDSISWTEQVFCSSIIDFICIGTNFIWLIIIIIIIIIKNVKIIVA